MYFFPPGPQIAFNRAKMKTPKLKTRKHILVMFMLIMACSKTQFASDTPACQGSGIACIRSNGVDTFDYTIQGSTLPVDILFVVDNTASMYAIQQQIGNKFPSFFNTVSNYDYHIGITTTDISDPTTNPPRSVNQNGALQDGKLIAFPNGQSYLSNDPNAESNFLSTIQRQETLNCEQWIASNCSANGCGNTAAYAANCPSEDSRAIYASYLNVTQNSSGFLRDTAPLDIVIISNSDERITGGQTSTLPLLPVDMPLTLISTVRTQFNNVKPLKVHSIIIKPNDTACYNAQHFSNIVFGWYAPVYNTMSVDTGGSVNSICSSDFGQALANIGNDVVSSMNSVTLYCIPNNNSVTVTYGNSGTSTINNVTSYTLQLPRAVQSNESLRVQYSCNSL